MLLGAVTFLPEPLPIVREHEADPLEVAAL